MMILPKSPTIQHPEMLTVKSFFLCFGGGVVLFVCFVKSFVLLNPLSPELILKKKNRSKDNPLGAKMNGKNSVFCCKAN